MKRPAAFLIATAALFAGTVNLTSVCAQDAPPAPPWQENAMQDHVLAGRVWLPEGQSFATPQFLLERLAKARFVLLGETHDNPDHHRLQAWVTGVLMRDRRLGLAFEMFDSGQQAAIDDYRDTGARDALNLGDATGWSGTGWPDWALYAPIADAALRAGTPIVAANIPRATVRGLMKNGYDALSPGRVAELGLDQPLPAPMRDAIAQDIAVSHCGRVTAAQALPFARIQAVRDAAFADALLRAGRGQEGAILIAGTGHVRSDRGVPWHLERRKTAGRVFAIAFVEVVPELENPGDYARLHRSAPLPFDAVWFTPRKERPDPCQAFSR